MATLANDSIIASSSSSLVGSGGPQKEEYNSNGIVDHKYPNNRVIFVGKGNPAPSRYVIINKSEGTEQNVKAFADNFLLRGLEKDGGAADEENGFLTKPPGVLISVTGGALAFAMPSSKFDQVFKRGMLTAARNIGAWIVDGGLDEGVMKFVGKAIKEMAVDDVPCIGIASHKMVILNEMLQGHVESATAAEYVANEPNGRLKCALNPNHTHFILVDSPTANWGEEIELRSNLEQYLRERFSVPVVLIVVNGGPGTLDTVAKAAAKNFAIVVVQGSGRASDAIAALVKKAQLTNANCEHTSASLMAIHGDGVDTSPWQGLLAEAKGNLKSIGEWTQNMDTILKNHTAITLFNSDDEAAADMDIFILRAILSSPGRKLSLEEKLMLGILWDRDDIIGEILDKEEVHLSSESKRDALNSAFELSLVLNRPKIFSILAEKGAKKEAVNMERLYYYRPLQEKFHRLPAYARTRFVQNSKSFNIRNERVEIADEPKSVDSLDFDKHSAQTHAMLKEVFRSIGGALHGYHVGLEVKFGFKEKTLYKSYNEESEVPTTTSVTFTDFLIWACIVENIELAKAIWRRTNYPVHSALVACQVCRYLSNHCNKEGYLESADWFENEAIKILDYMEDYANSKIVLEWKWRDMANKTPLSIAQHADCKRFVCHPHVQRLLDDKFYSDEYGNIEPTTSGYRIWLSIILPPLIYLIYSHNNKNPKESSSRNLTVDPSSGNRFYQFYRLPIVKFWTNTFFYLAFLFVQGYVLCTLRNGDDYHSMEIILWIWVFSLIVDEFSQYLKDPHDHFTHLSNFMDLLLLVLHVIYMVLRWASYETHNNNTPPPDPSSSGSIDQPSASRVFEGSVNVLIVACLFSWARLLNAFAISSSLGPLYFIIIRLFKDIFLWLFVFVIFAVSFQLGFINITMQAGDDPLSTYPTGSFPVSFFTIIGDYGYANDIMDKAPLGIALLAVYALLAQIILVNLLIAMMGATYSSVSENSAVEWKFYRVELIMEYESASFHPPPSNIIVAPLQFLIDNYGRCTRKPPSTPELASPLVRDSTRLTEEDQKIAIKKKVYKVMRIARDNVIDSECKEDAEAILSIINGLKDRLRTLANERENDRTHLDKKFKDLGAILHMAANQAASGGSNTGMGGVALGELQNTVQVLQQSNQLLVQQNQQILTLLQTQHTQQQHMQQHLQQLQHHTSSLGQLQVPVEPPRSSSTGGSGGIRSSSDSRRGTVVSDATPNTNNNNNNNNNNNDNQL